jgi:hypothetical protein
MPPDNTQSCYNKPQSGCDRPKVMSRLSSPQLGHVLAANLAYENRIILHMIESISHRVELARIT